MKTYTSNEITFMQFIFLHFGMTISIGFLSLPRVLAEKVGTDGWISLLISWLITIPASLIVVQIMKKHPQGTLLDLLTRYWGKWAGKACAIVFALYFLYYGYTGIVYTVLITKAWLLPQTPPYEIMALLLVPTYIIARNEVRILGRYAELVVLMSVWIPIVYLLPLKYAHWLYLLPVVKEGWNPIFSAVPEMFYFNVGFASTFILYPFLQNKQLASAGIIIASTLTMLTYLSIAIICFIYFSPDGITDYNQPAINILKSIEFKFIERVEVMFIAFYTLIFSLSWILPMYISVFCTSWMVGKQDHRNHLRWLCLLIAVGTCFIMPTFNQSEQMNTFLGKIGFVLEYIAPCMFLIYLWLHDRIRGKKE
jgi:spore germination protein (amino acid permease)